MPDLRALVVAHDHVSPAGHVGRRLVERGFELVHHLVVPAADHAHPDVTTTFPDFAGFDVVVLLGAPWAVYDEALIGRWLEPERAQVRAATAAGVPVLGVCFGGQLLAAVLGGSVAASPAPEVGWTEVRPCGSGSGSGSDDPVVPPGPWFQWHFDRWTLPPGAEELARNDAASQAFRVGRNLAVQFHPELTADGLVGWIENGGRATLLERGLDPEALVAAMRADEAGDDVAYRRTARLVDAFLDRVAGPGLGRPAAAALP